MMKHVVEIYSKPECHLCDEAKDVLQEIQKKNKFTLTETDITTDQGVYEKYKEEIPVIFINGRKAFKYKVTEKEFLQKLNRKILPHSGEE